MYDATGSSLAVDTAPASPARRTGKAVRSPWNRRNPYPATVVTNELLSGPGSAKEVRHLELDLGDSGISYEPGDGIGIAPANDPELVDLLLNRLGAAGDEIIADRKATYTLREALTSRYEISAPSKYLVRAVADRTGHPELSRLLDAGDPQALDAWLHGLDVLDLLDLDPTFAPTPEELLEELSPLAHREYSISSSPRVHGDTVHITMATVRYTVADRDRGGVCSTHLADRCAPGDTVPVFVSPNKKFRLPADDVAAVMIGPGTGIAPFRAFLHERAATGATGSNWLFFGDQHRAHDHLYAEELDRLVAGGVLDRLDLAFSRDQEHKVYVQDRMREHGAELFAWLEAGAHLYVCGDAATMADDVDAALHEIVAEHGGLDADQAAGYVDGLRSENRYLRDVY
ncbi:sulfite reductase subunit alpha [Gordonia terrae]|uniref:assimilatory sulfite reductase (NADPH) n=2 Tax=Gordonia terrae TaxID=2055 RepID=A0AAD0K8U5_9ACTN|nr:sulfite reductase subunit alpha [Gordonia terrae]VTR09972.1 Sulfite reductase [NADPH] flavoprotein alpha-component [Clostridioides difficile]ANY23077.1 FAD-binding protein [Gordonia terrae]AWO83805.1 sulfite reductase subunit alpha [Gordonia terrae]VTS47586.1 Sulfite reductase [NADPH] flavoprotein alpha-component [Gordonia terrae]GAB44388.1 NADPH--sulfite reductase flavoprotein alpha-component [Gordonia terrae NBRC 100016]